MANECIIGKIATFTCEYRNKKNNVWVSKPYRGIIIDFSDANMYYLIRFIDDEYKKLKDDWHPENSLNSPYRVISRKWDYIIDIESDIPNIDEL